MNRISGRRRKVRPGMSVKLKITLWFTAFMTIISGICLILILTIDSQVARNQAYSLLSDTVRENVGKVRLTGNRQLDLDQDFSFYKNGVYILLYNKNKALLSRPRPISPWTQNWKMASLRRFPAQRTASMCLTCGFPPVGRTGCGSAARSSAITAARKPEAYCPCFSSYFPLSSSQPPLGDILSSEGP